MKSKPKVVKKQRATTYISDIWGQSVSIEEPFELRDVKDRLVSVTVSDFDSGQTVKVVIEAHMFKEICEDGLAMLGHTQPKGR